MAREVKMVRDENLAASVRSEAALSSLLTRFGPAAQASPVRVEKGR
jgi:hypothetical protein